MRCRGRDEIWYKGGRGAQVRAAGWPRRMRNQGRRERAWDCGWPRRKEKSDKPAKMRYYSRTERQNAAKPMKMTAEMRTEGENYAANSYSKSAE